MGVRMVEGDGDINTVGVMVVAVVGRERHAVGVMVGNNMRDCGHDATSTEEHIIMLYSPVSTSSVKERQTDGETHNIHILSVTSAM